MFNYNINVIYLIKGYYIIYCFICVFCGVVDIGNIIFCYLDIVNFFVVRCLFVFFNFLLIYGIYIKVSKL